VQQIPVISETKNYWLVRTVGGKYYNDFRKGGFIAINWDKISIEEINDLPDKDLTARIKKDYPDKPRPARTANQLRIFSKVMKKGDAVIITSTSSNNLSIGEVLEDEPFVEYIKEEQSEGRQVCPFQKRKRVHWIKQLHKWELELNLFKLMQHAQHTISSANEYADLIESLIHNFYIRGNQAQLVLQVKKEGKIPMSVFFRMGADILNLAEEFNQFSKTIKLNIDEIDTKINVNSPGKIKLTGAMATITIIGLILVGLTGGHYKVDFPVTGGGLDVQMNSLIKEVSDFLDHRQEKNQEDTVLKAYMNRLEVKTPEELTAVLKAIKDSGNSSVQQIDPTKQ
jgi:restriction system protein